MGADIRLKVLHIITRLDPGGSTINTLETVARLDPSRFEVELWAGRTVDPSGEAAVFIDRYKLRVTYIHELVRDVHPLKDIMAFSRLYGMLRHGKFDIVHTHSSKAGILGRWAARLAGVRHIVHTPHGHIFYGYFSRSHTQFFLWLERASARISSRLIALTEKGVREHLSLGVGTPAQWCAIPSGIDVAAFAPSGDERRAWRQEFHYQDTDVVFIMAGRLVPIKNHRTALEAMALVARDNPQVRLLIVGDGPEEKDLRELARAQGVEAKVHFAGYRSDLARLLNAGDVFLMPSLNEGMGRAVLEAMAVGLPCIVSNAGGLPDLVNDGEQGFLVEATDVEAWANAMRQLITSTMLCLRMSAAARARITERFSITSMVRSIENVYERRDEAMPRLPQESP